MLQRWHLDPRHQAWLAIELQPEEKTSLNGIKLYVSVGESLEACGLLVETSRSKSVGSTVSLVDDDQDVRL